jgi:hypothetical protein
VDACFLRRSCPATDAPTLWLPRRANPRGGCPVGEWLDALSGAHLPVLDRVDTTVAVEKHDLGDRGILGAINLDGAGSRRGD